MEQLLLGIDVGTTGTKAALFAVNGELQAVGQAEYGTTHAQPGTAEQAPDDWWLAVCSATQQALRQIQHGRERVAGIAVSSQAPTMLPLGKAGQPLRPALIWMDRRAEAEANQLKNLVGQQTVERISGNRADPFYVAPKLLWYKQHEPALFEKTSYFVQANGYINYKLTGTFTLDNVHASLLQLRDWQQDTWATVLCEACGVQPEQFPAIYPGHHIQGEVTAAAAEATGLKAGTPVMVGTVDGAAAAVEAGAVAPGIAAEMTGTSTVLLLPNDQHLSEPVFIAMPHALPGLDLLLGAMATTGASLRWFRDQFGQLETEAGTKLKLDSYDMLTMQAAEIAIGSQGVIFLPYMMGERAPLWHTNARGVFFGLSLATSKAALIRAILEGTAFALKHNVEVAQQLGLSVNEVRTVGGGSRSALWNQIKADVLGVPVLLPRTSVGAPFGDAILVGLGLGLYPDVQQALQEMVQIEHYIEPDMKAHVFYQEMFQIYRSIYEHVHTDFDSLAALSMKKENE